MKSVLLIGLNNFGMLLAKKLHELGHEVLAVDKNEECVSRVLPFVTGAQIGDTTEETFLRSLGINNFDVCFVAIGCDFQSSLETTSLLKELGAKLVVSRADRDMQAQFLLRNGADEVIDPEKQIAEWAAIRYSSRSILDYIKLDEEHGIFEITVPPEWTGQSIGRIDIRKKYGITIMGFRENGRTDLSVTPDTVLRAGQTMLVLGDYRAVRKCFRI